VVPSVATAWVTGPAAPSWLVASGLDCDDRGYPLADESLALTTEGTAFGGGDCVTLRHAPDTAKAGVYAVRMAPILAANVRSAMLGVPPAARYTPQRDFLALLSTSDGAALLRWHSIALESRWAHHLKRWIDDRYLRRYQALAG
jgi:NADH dehydrogenase FAD-containing subunit